MTESAAVFTLGWLIVVGWRRRKPTGLLRRPKTIAGRCVVIRQPSTDAAPVKPVSCAT